MAFCCDHATVTICTTKSLLWHLDAFCLLKFGLNFEKLFLNGCLDDIRNIYLNIYFIYSRVHSFLHFQFFKSHFHLNSRCWRMSPNDTQCYYRFDSISVSSLISGRLGKETVYIFDFRSKNGQLFPMPFSFVCLYKLFGILIEAVPGCFYLGSFKSVYKTFYIFNIFFSFFLLFLHK